MNGTVLNTKRRVIQQAHIQDEADLLADAHLRGINDMGVLQSDGEGQLELSSKAIQRRQRS